ncbi:muscarinic acetylcholine receptor M2-like [Pomacea canaliculata]|uniref:muscarinic acetylcholine receptor M2-like n=1 Tax=Pomacea canaliculata TaxID=400727 RepID=UPI000D734147|nr:muscarinic acetylcholine receptor M2-like [Pomacea canaliculata]
MATVSDSTSVSTSGNLTAVENLTKFVQLANLTPSVIFLSLLILLGLPGNTLIFFIYWRYFKASSTRVFVLSMAVTDLFTSALSCPSYIIQLHYLYRFVYPYSCASIFVIQRLPVVTSGWLLVAVALDRRHRICHPLKRQLSPRQAVYLVIVSLILSSVATFPFIPLRREMTVSFGDDQVFGKRCEITDRFTGTAHRIAERWTLMLSLALGVLIMISSYVHIGYQLYRQKKRREIALYMELQGKFRKEEDKNWKGFLAKVTEDQEVKVKTKDASSGFISEDFVELSKDVKTTTSEFLLSQKELASANMETVDTSLTVKTDVRMITVGTAATSPGVDATVPSSTVETFATSAGDHSTVTSAGDSSTVAVHLGNCDVKKTKESKSRHMGTKIQSRTTLMMFIITVTAIVAYLPYVVVASTNEDEFAYCLQMEKWRMNWCMIALLFININSIVNPFIYSFCNPAFRHKCCQLLNFLRNLLPVR